MRYRIATITLCFWILGIFLGSFSVTLLPKWYWWSFITCLPIAIWRKPIALMLIVFLVGFGYSRVWRRWYTRSFPADAETFTGKVVAIPDLRDRNQYLTVAINETLAQNIQHKPTTGLVLVKADRYLPVNFGDTVWVKATLEAPAKFDQFNYPLFLERDHIFSIAPQARVNVIEENTSWSLTATLANARGKLEQIISRYIPEPEGSFLAGLLFGSKRAIPSDVTNALRATSTSHLVAISGANITFIVAMALGLLPVTNRWGQAGIVVLVSGGLSLLTGAPASVVRGAVIASTNSVVRAFGRRSWPAAGILLAASLMLIGNPLLIRADPGFQLSFAAYGGLLLFSNSVAWIATKLRVPQAIRGSFTETGSATLGTAPLSVVAGSFAIRGLLVNPLVLWLIPPATALGFILLIAALIPPIAKLIAIPTWGILHLALGIILVSGHIGNTS